MTLLRGIAIALVAIVLLAGAGLAFYLFGPNAVSSAQLVPGDTILFASIPNAASIAGGYETSQLKKLVDAPQTQPLFDEIQHVMGDKNLALLKVFLPDLSGQSFVALTHFDPNHPLEAGFVAAMKPKPGTDNFDTFVTQVNAAYPDLARETKTGQDKLLGVDYKWIEGAHSPGRICVAHYHGWIVTAWGEGSLQDWIERMQGKSATPSLADNADYKKSLDRIGAGSQAVLYLDYHAMMQLLIDHLDQQTPGFGPQMQKQLAGIGPAAIGASFDHGEIADHFSILEPKEAQLAHGMTAEPCAFETLKFTGPDTLLYLAASVDWNKIWQNFQAQVSAQPAAFHLVFDQLNSWAQGENIDVQKNIFDALGSEYSMQMEWPPDESYPDLGIFLKIDKPDAFKPVITAIVDGARKAFATTGVITEMSSGGLHFATLKLVSPMPISPTITEDGPWFGLFLNPTHAVRSMARDESRGLLHNDDFNREIGDQRQGAAEIVYFNSPRFFDRTYRTALPFVSMGAMFNPTLASLLKDRNLPPDLTWLAPMGPWGVVVKSDDDGLTGYSRSGIGNQGIMLGVGAGLSAGALEMSGLLPHQPAPHFTAPVPGNPNATPPPPPGAVVTPPAPAIAPAPAATPTNQSAPVAPVPSSYSPPMPTPPAPPPVPSSTSTNSTETPDAPPTPPASSTH
jgi:hypothetical protein